MKRLFILTISSLILPSLAFASFSDVSSSNQFYNAINYVQQEDIVQGYPDGTYKPDNQINRAEFTKIIIGATYTKEGIEQCLNVASALMTYSDITKNEWYASYLCIATLNSIVKGYDNGTFKPSNQINLAEASKIIFKSFNSNVPDINSSPWYRQYVEYLEKKAAIPTSITSADKLITRGEMAEIIYRLRSDITDKPTTSFFYTPSAQNNDFTLDIRISDTTLNIGDTIEGGTYYMKYTGTPFEGVVLYKKSVIGDTLKTTMTTPPSIIENIDFDNPEKRGQLSWIPEIKPFTIKESGIMRAISTTETFEASGTYKYTMSVYSCTDIAEKMDYTCDDGMDMAHAFFVDIVDPLATVSKSVTVSE